MLEQIGPQVEETVVDLGGDDGIGELVPITRFDMYARVFDAAKEGDFDLLESELAYIKPQNSLYCHPSSIVKLRQLHRTWKVHNDWIQWYITPELVDLFDQNPSDEECQEHFVQAGTLEPQWRTRLIGVVTDVANQTCEDSDITEKEQGKLLSLAVETLHEVTGRSTEEVSRYLEVQLDKKIPKDCPVSYRVTALEQLRREIGETKKGWRGKVKGWLEGLSIVNLVELSSRLPK